MSNLGYYNLHILARKNEKKRKHNFIARIAKTCAACFCRAVLGLGEASERKFVSLSTYRGFVPKLTFLRVNINVPAVVF